MSAWTNSKVLLGNRFQGPRASEAEVHVRLTTLTDGIILNRSRQQRDISARLGIGHRVFELMYRRSRFLTRGLLPSGIAPLT